MPPSVQACIVIIVLVQRLVNRNVVTSRYKNLQKKNAVQQQLEQSACQRERHAAFIFMIR